MFLLSVPNWAGQEAVKASSVLVVGVGGLGCPCALYLTAAGIGKHTITTPFNTECGLIRETGTAGL